MEKPKYDVVVVGKGNAALCAALSARDKGGRRDSVTLCGRVRERRQAPVLEPLSGNSSACRKGASNANL
jgi:succinate dehydrogenase/fumarate reductase flavoprotein subunit